MESACDSCLSIANHMSGRIPVVEFLFKRFLAKIVGFFKLYNVSKKSRNQVGFLLADKHQFTTFAKVPKITSL